MSKPKTSTRPPLRLIDFAKQRRDADRRDTRLVLQALLERAENGQIDALALCFKDAEGAEHWVLTGAYEDPKNAINAAARVTWRMCERQETE
jgi:hypothetical protein